MPESFAQAMLKDSFLTQRKTSSIGPRKTTLAPGSSTPFLSCMDTVPPSSSSALSMAGKLIKGKVVNSQMSDARATSLKSGYGNGAIN